MKRLLFLSMILLVLLISCNQSNQIKTSKKHERFTTAAPAFDADSAFHFVKVQTDFGARVPNTEAHLKCAQWLHAKLAQYCDHAVVQSFSATTFDGVKINGKNIIGSLFPEKKRRVLLAAHWDSRPFADNDPDPSHRNTPIEGANDGASGVGVLLEIARQLKEKSPEIGVDIVFFDAEDWGPRGGQNETGDWWCLGSQHWARNSHIAHYKADYGILLDMVGAPDAKFLQEGYSTKHASQIVAKVWAKAYQLGNENYFVNSPGNPITDDHYYVYRLANIPMINIIHQEQNTGTGFFSMWHTLQDNISHIDRNTLYAVGTTVLAVIYDERYP
jgi:Zn-dependent M28 family amino/carboxypeptidase